MYWNPRNWGRESIVKTLCAFILLLYWANETGNIKPIFGVIPVYLYYAYANWKESKCVSVYRHMSADDIAKLNDHEQHLYHHEQHLYLAREYEKEGRMAEADYYRNKTHY